MELKNLLSKPQIKEISSVISKAEMLTSGEIRLHLEEECGGNVESRALEVFYKLKMNKTELQNGVLLYISYKDQKFAICGDKGIHEKVPKRFWKSIRNALQRAFKKGKFFEGIVLTIMECGRRLKEYFPYQKDDINELENHVTFKKDLK